MVIFSFEFVGNPHYIFIQKTSINLHLVFPLQDCELVMCLLKKSVLSFFWTSWVFTAATAFLQLQCAGFSLMRLLLWQRASGCTGFGSCGSQALEDRPSSYGAWVQLFRSMCDLPRSGIEPVSPALAGRFFTTEPPGRLRVMCHTFLYFQSLVGTQSLSVE